MLQAARPLPPRGGQRRPGRAGAAGGGGVGTAAPSHLCSFGRDASRRPPRAYVFPLPRKRASGHATFPRTPEAPPGVTEPMGGGRRLAAAALRQAGVCERRRRWRLRPAPYPFPSPSPGGGTQAFPRLQRTLGGGSGASQAPSPRRPRCLPHTDSTRTPFAHSHIHTHSQARAHTRALPAGSPCSGSSLGSP